MQEVHILFASCAICVLCVRPWLRPSLLFNIMRCGYSKASRTVSRPLPVEAETNSTPSLQRFLFKNPCPISAATSQITYADKRSMLCHSISAQGLCRRESTRVSAYVTMHQLM